MPDAPETRLSFHPTAIGGVFEVERHPRADHRGRFARLFCAEEYAAAGLFAGGAVQINLATTTRAGSVRGMHHQQVRPDGSGEAKLVTCVVGRVFDVALDVRVGSPTFGRHHAVELAGDGTTSLLIPPGVAHGMQALEDDVTLLYVHGAAYDPALERGVRPDDPALAIGWPLPVVALSDRDRALPDLAALETR
ncbi:MAG: dTDP-4-dehydrorhamnose 3,5-epimerase family protein [Planctomycetota bacterium]